MTFGSLFAGIGGLDLGLERAGMTCKWQVEIDDYANKVLEKHWPNVTRWKDVRTFPPDIHVGRDRDAGLQDEWTVDLICGGFPCQGISIAGDRGGIESDERSGLWTEYLRVVRLLRPRIVLVENVPAMLVPIIKDGRRIENAAIGRVLGDLASLRFDAEWGVLSARNFGAIHLRERVFIVGYNNEDGWCSSWQGCASKEGASDIHNAAARHSNNRKERRQRIWQGPLHRVSEFSWCKDVRRVEDLQGRSDLPEPLLRRNRDGVPNLVDRLGCLGNSVVPAAAEWLGRRILEAEA